MKNRRVVWTKGMFLNPQHFQAQDQYFEDSLQFRFMSSCYANWGVVALGIDSEALANGTFRLTEARGLLPDGLSFRMPDLDPLPPGRAVGESFGATDRELDVFLSIPEEREGAPNVTIEDGSGKAAPPDTRYTAELYDVADLNAGQERKPVQIARKNFRILFGNEYRDGFSAIRIAQVVRNPAGAPILKPTHIAPCLDIAHNEYLMGLLRRQVEILANKGAEISATRREQRRGQADFKASEITNLWLLHTINTALPELQHIWRVRHGHPEQAFLALSRLAGALSTLSLDSGPGDLPAYDHNDLGTCFSGLDQQIQSLVGAVIDEGYVPIPLTLGDHDVWTATVPDDRLFEDSQFYLAVSADMDAGELIQKVPMRVKVAAGDDITRVIERALAGLSLSHTQSPPAIRVKLGNQYFALGQNGALWDKIRASRRVAVFAPADLRDPKLELIAVRSR